MWVSDEDSPARVLVNEEDATRQYLHNLRAKSVGEIMLRLMGQDNIFKPYISKYTPSF